MGIAFLACTTTTVQVVPDRADTGPESAGDDTDAAAPDAGSDAHVAAPPREQIPNNGGPVIASPEIVTITWQGDTINDGLEAFDDWLVASDTWKTMMAEWGVGPGTHLASYRVPTAAPGNLDDSDVKKLLQDAFAAGSIPPPNGSRIYTVYPPSGTSVTSFGSKACDTFQAYHSSFTYSGADAGPPALAIYAITPRCDGGAADGMQPLDYVTWGQSHEVMEASSDPDAMHPTWVIEQQTDATPDPGENADLCTSNPTKVDGHMITRNYSNAAAARGERVCVPAPPGPDFGGYVDPLAITLKPGSATTVPLHLYANGAMPDFTVLAYPGNSEITVKQSAKTGNDGTVVMLTVTTSTKYVEQEGANLVYLLAYTKDYASRRALIVHSN
ncbi:MAG TPA: hypothetical protein VIF62_02275 [Labilithrix sp.]